MSTNLHIDDIGNLILRDGKLGLCVSSQYVTPPHYGGGRVGALSPYAYCGGDPVNLVDPTGEAWYTVSDSISIMGYQFICNVIDWTDCNSQEEMDIVGQKGEFLGDRVLYIEGYLDERLGTDGTLDGPGAKCATAIAFGSAGPSDVAEYRAFTMSSDYSAYGAIADGDYQITFSQKKYDYWNNNPQKRKIPKYYQVNNCQPIDCIDYNHSWLRNEGYSFWQKNGIYLHRTNKNGTAKGRVSTGCILIDGRDWDDFENQMGHNSMRMIIHRNKPFYSLQF